MTDAFVASAKSQVRFQSLDLSEERSKRYMALMAEEVQCFQVLNGGVEVLKSLYFLQ